MNIKNSLFFLLASLGIAILAGSVHADEQQAGFEVGILKCTVIPGTRVNLLIRTTADVECAFDNRGTIERYKGETGIALGSGPQF